MSSYQAKKKHSAFSAQSMSYLETLYDDFLMGQQDDVNQSFLDYFVSIHATAETNEQSHRAVIEQMKRHIRSHYQSNIVIQEDRFFSIVCENIIDWYMSNGHFHANTGMLEYARLHSDVPEFSLARLGISDDDLQQALPDHLSITVPNGRTIQDLINFLQVTFQSSVGYEIAHLQNQAEKEWLLQQLVQPLEPFSVDEKMDFLRLLTQSEQLEHYLARTHVGQKRFSIEGAESFILAMEGALFASVESGVEEVVLGMAHRGRLNTMVNTLGLPCGDIDGWFKGFQMTSEQITGDVKYHLGYSTDREISGQQVHITLNFNPSHLESIAPVTMGSVRARQDLYADNAHQAVLPILVHGDASFVGQGVVAESLNMSYTAAYDVGGSIHVIINNQIGFTTTPDESRSSYYCTDFAKSIGAPIFHVNGDDPEAVVRAARLAAKYRNRFNRDVVIDILSYRRHGHNEADEASATNPLLYADIKLRPSVVDYYSDLLVRESVLSKPDVMDLQKQIRDKIKSGQRLIEVCPRVVSKREYFWKDHVADDWRLCADTSISTNKIQELKDYICHVPEDFKLQRQVAMMLSARQRMYNADGDMNWGAAEALAFASLLYQGVSIRLVGQDSCRGTFAHRHAKIYDQNTGKSVTICATLSGDDRGGLYIYNSTLSEFAAMGFEYGYSISSPNTLVLWEAQFGDFANGAQVMIDQYITSAWQKWGRMSGLVLLLPHGYEGQGPEHSSARLERYLQLCAQNNIQVCVPSTPGQYFHLLRRQIMRRFRAPLVVIMPKSLLRNPRSVTSLSGITHGQFQLVLNDVLVDTPALARRLILCSGKVYFDLVAMIEKHQLKHIAVCRLEQLYPFPSQELSEIITDYKHIETIVWCQEEPNNQGAWYVLRARIAECLLSTQRLVYAGRPKMASSAPGDFKQFSVEQDALIDDALGLNVNSE